MSCGNCFLTVLHLALGTQHDGPSPSQPSTSLRAAPGDCQDRAPPTVLVWSRLPRLEKALLAVNSNLLCYGFSPRLLGFLHQRHGGQAAAAFCPPGFTDLETLPSPSPPACAAVDGTSQLIAVGISPASDSRSYSPGKTKHPSAFPLTSESHAPLVPGASLTGLRVKTAVPGFCVGRCDFCPNPR